MQAFQFTSLWLALLVRLIIEQIFDLGICARDKFGSGLLIELILKASSPSSPIKRTQNRGKD